MFPLETVIFPGQVLPIHVFEERYRTMMSDLFDDESQSPAFGSVLIEKGHEVGGGDSRLDVGCECRVVQASRFDDGRWGLIVAGLRRIEVLAWLDDADYPRALITMRSRVDDGGHDLDGLRDVVFDTISLAAAASGADPVDLDSIQLSADPLERLDQLSALSPLTDFDRQKVLQQTRTSEQIALLGDLTREKRQLLGPEIS